MKILREMGRFAALINSIPTNGFGSSFDWSSNQLSHNETFDEYLQKELRVEARLQTLQKRRVLSAGQIKNIRAIFADAVKSNLKPSLNHGDVRLKNVIVDEQGEIKALLDWEHCASNLAPQWELALALHDLSIDGKQAFLEGYGLKEKKFAEISSLIKAFNIINYAPEIERLAEAKDAARLEQYRTRLSGAFDLYSLTTDDKIRHLVKSNDFYGD
jgi:hygromycin-B 4-O-kinase